MHTIKLSKRVVLTILFFLILLNILLRFPSTPHEIGNDGFMNQALAKYITQEGYASWHTSPLSFFGLGSFTYPAAYQFLLSGFSQLSGLSLETSVLVISMVVGVFGAVFAFLMTREIFKDDFIALISAFLFSTAPLFLRITNWNASARQLFMVFMPLLIFIMLRTDFVKKAEKKNFIGMEKYSSLTLILLLVMGMMHRVAIYLVFVIAAFILAIILYRMKNTFTAKTGVMKFKLHYRMMFVFFIIWIGIISLFIYMQLENIGPYDGMNLWYKYQTGFFFSGSDPVTIFMNMVIDYGSSFGILSVFGIIGAFFLFRTRAKEYSIIFLILSLILLSPLYTIGLYTQLLVFVFFFILVAMGVFYIIQVKRLRKIVFPLIITFLLISTIFSVFMINHWQKGAGGNYMTESEYDTAIFANTYISENETFVTNNQVFGNRILGIADIQFLTEDFPYPLIYGWVDKEDARKEFNLKAIWQNRSPIVISPLEYQIMIDHRRIMFYGVEQNENLLERYSVKYMIESSQTTGSRNIVNSLEIKRFKLYDNGQECIWKL